MNLIINPYSIILLFFGIITIIFGNYLYRKGTVIVRWFSLMMISSAIWTIGVAFEIASPTILLGYFFTKIEYIGIVQLPIYWLIFTLHFNHINEWHKKKRNIIALLIIPVIGFIAVWTNHYHHWYFTDLRFSDNSIYYNIISYNPGPVYWVFVGYFYTIILVGFYFIIKGFKKSNKFSRVQKIIILFFATLPWLGNIGYQIGIRPLGDLELTPFLFIITSLAVGLGIYYYKLFNIIPYVRKIALDLMEEGFIVLDEHLSVVDYNHSIYYYIGTHHKKTLGVQVFELIGDYPELIEKLQNQTNGTLELQAIRYEQNKYFQTDILHVQEDFNNYIILKFRDITLAKKEVIKAQQQSEELKKLNSLKDKVFSVIAHDLRSPVINISSVFNLLNEGDISQEEFKKILPKLSQDIIYTTEMLENLLHWSRSQLKGFGIKKEFFSIRTIIQNEINYYNPVAKAKNIEIINDVFPNEFAYADIIIFQIVVRNLLNNAIKFSKENGSIFFNASIQKSKMIKINIEDNGVGISRENLLLLFSKNKLTTLGTKQEKGTGLGLLICKELMEKNGGNIQVDSELGIGTKFQLLLPILEEQSNN